MSWLNKALAQNLELVPSFLRGEDLFFRLDEADFPNIVFFLLLLLLLSKNICASHTYCDFII